MDALKREIKAVADIISTLKPDDVVVLSHADHDGLTSTVLLDLYFFNEYKRHIKRFHPTKKMTYYRIFRDIMSLKPKYLFIMDVVITPYRKYLKEVMRKDTFVINLDHHDIIAFESKRYLNLNPHCWGLEYINSSGLVWLIMKQIDSCYFKERCWVAGIGALQDYCIEDNKELMLELVKAGHLKEPTLSSALDSDLIKIAKAINMATNIYPIGEVYKIIFKAAYSNSLDEIRYDEKMVRSFKLYEVKIQETLKLLNARVISHRDKLLKCYDLSGEPIFVLSEICEREREEAIYIGYSNGLLGFRSLFCEYDIRKLARLFGGGGAHPRVAGAKTRKSFEEVINDILRFLEAESVQRSLLEYI